MTLSVCNLPIQLFQYDSFGMQFAAEQMAGVRVVALKLCRKAFLVVLVAQTICYIIVH